MLKISISSELADEHPQFMAACAANGREVRVFDAEKAGDERGAAEEEPHVGTGAGRREKPTRGSAADGGLPAGTKMLGRRR